MANSQYGHVIYCDAAGILSKTPLEIIGVLHYPTAVSEVLDLDFWDEMNPISASKISVNGTITATHIFTDAASTAITSAAFPAGDVVKIYSEAGLAANNTYHQIADAGNNTSFHTIAASLADDGPHVHNLVTYPARPFFNCLQPTVADTFESKWHYLGGVRVPNLICGAITAGYALIYFK